MGSLRGLSCINQIQLSQSITSTVGAGIPLASVNPPSPCDDPISPSIDPNLWRFEHGNFEQAIALLPDPFPFLSRKEERGPGHLSTQVLF